MKTTVIKLTKEQLKKNLDRALAAEEPSDAEIIAAGDYPEIPVPNFNPETCQCRVGTKMLEVKLTHEEIGKFATEAAETRTRISELEKEKAEVAKNFKARIDGLGVKAAEAEAFIISGVKDRSIKIVTVRDTSVNEGTIYRLDGEAPEMVRRYTMQLDERAKALDAIQRANPTPDEPAADETGEVPLDIAALLREAPEAIRVAWDTIKAGQVDGLGRAAVKALVAWAHKQGLDPDEHGPIQDAISSLSARTAARKAAEGGNETPTDDSTDF